MIELLNSWQEENFPCGYLCRKQDTHMITLLEDKALTSHERIWKIKNIPRMTREVKINTIGPSGLYHT